MKDLNWTWRWILRVPREQLWPLVADTDRFNRYTGLPPLQYRPLVAEGVPRREATMRRRGIKLVWEEYPFEFEEPRHFSVLRRYRTGPAAEMQAGVELLPHSEGTELVYRVRVRPRFALASLPIRFEIGVRSYRSFDRAFREIERAARQGAEPYREPPALDESLRSRLREALGITSDTSPLLEYLLDASDSELYRIRPFRVAKKLGVEGASVLAACLDATVRGVLEATWTILCPHCRGPKVEAGALANLQFDSYCESCAIDFTADFDRLTELVFRLSPRWKRLSVGEYCIGGPGLTPHIVLQFCLAAGSQLSRSMNLADGTYRVRSTSSAQPLFLTVANEGTMEAAVPIASERVGDGELVVQPSALIHFENRSARDALVSIERTEWADDTCSAAYVSTFQQFRDLFGKDVLAPGIAVKVGAVTILFTDLKDSTAMYGRIGDASAFGLVRSHFDVLFEAVRKNQGAVIKTIGDAVMACFLNLAEAVEAGIEMHRKIGAVPTRDGQLLILKIGAYAGPCFAVTMNEALDYFGTSVNLAARVQAHSLGNDIVLDLEQASRPDIRSLLSGLQVEEFEADLKGFEGKSRKLLRARLGGS